MFSHVNVGARDLPRLATFYDAVLAPLGLTRAGDGTIGGQPGLLWRRPGQRWPQFCVQPPWGGLPATWGNGVQVSFAAPSRRAAPTRARPGCGSATPRTSTVPTAATRKATSCDSCTRMGCGRAERHRDGAVCLPAKSEPGWRDRQRLSTRASPAPTSTPPPVRLSPRRKAGRRTSEDICTASSA